MICFFRPLARVAAIICVGIAIAAPVTHATVGQPGTLDPTWATSSPLGAGKLITPVGTSNDYGLTALLQPDGKVVQAGGCVNGTTFVFCAVRYSPTGTLDTSFNGNGIVLTPVSATSVATAAVLQPDGKIVLAGACSTSSASFFCVVRYLPTGALDASFNGTGIVVTSVGLVGQAAYAAAVLLQPDGKIVLAGTCTPNTFTEFCAVRYLSNGALDASFNGTGKLTTPVGSGDGAATVALLQPDGKIILAGNCTTATNNFCAVRYLSSGALDTSFNFTGKVITTVGIGGVQVKAALLQPDGNIVVAGSCLNGSNRDFCAVRYLPTGPLDTSFNGSGKIITTVGASNDVATAALLQPDGRIVLTGSCTNGTKDDFCLVRYLPSGEVDTSFNTGKFITAVGTSLVQANAALLQPDGKILVVGTCSGASNGDFCSVRYDGGPFGYQDCKPDFDGDGQILATTDALIFTRVALGITGNAVIGGINFAPNAKRNTWPLIRDYLVTQCGMSLAQ